MDWFSQTLTGVVFYSVLLISASEEEILSLIYARSNGKVNVVLNISLQAHANGLIGVSYSQAVFVNYLEI